MRRFVGSHDDDAQQDDDDQTDHHGLVEAPCAQGQIGEPDVKSHPASEIGSVIVSVGCWIFWFIGRDPVQLE